MEQSPSWEAQCLYILSNYKERDGGKSASSARMVIVRSQFSLDLQHLQNLQHLYRLAADNVKQEL